MKSAIVLFALSVWSAGLVTVVWAEKPAFRAGAAVVDITPTTLPVIVNGGFLERTADQVHDRLMSRALVLDDGSIRLAVVVVDNLIMEQDLIDQAKRLASQETGIPVQRMMVAATHTHSAPSVMACLGSRADPAYTSVLPGHIARSIVLAADSLQPARIGWTVVAAYEFNHCRRWIFRPDRIGSDPFGQSNVRAMMHPGHQSTQHVGPAGPADPDLSLLSLQTPGGQPIAVLANLAMHYKGAPAISADFCGRFGQALAAEIGAAEETDPPFVGMMSQGTSGDSMWMDYSRPRNDPGLDGYTQAVTQLAARAYAEIQYHDHVPLGMAERTLRLDRRLPDAARLAAAHVVAERLEQEKRLPRDRPEVYALEALYLHQQPELELKLQAIRVGDLGITAIPNEVYGLTGLKIKARSPLAPTFNISVANGAAGYIPPPEQFALGGYTTWPARTAGLEVDAEPKIVETLLELLEEVAGRPRVDRRPPVDAYVQAVLDLAPLAFWRMDEDSGWTAQDASGNQHTGRFEPGVAYFLPGRGPADLDYDEQTPHRAVHFAGGRMIAETAPLTGNWSLAFWLWNGLPVDAREVTGYLAALGSARNDSDLADHLWLTGAGQGGVLSFAPGDGPALVGKTPLNLRTWHHVVLVRDGRRVQVYLDGRAAPEIDGEVPAASVQQPRWYFGGSNDLRATWEGKLDDIAVFDRALSDDQVAALYRASGLTPPEPVPPPRTADVYPVRPSTTQDLARYAAAVAGSAPVAWWTLHEADDRQVPDASGNGSTATLEDGASARPPDGTQPNFAGGRMNAVLDNVDQDYSVAIWFWNEVPVTSRPVAGYFVSRGANQAKGADGEHLGIGGTHAATGRLIVFNGNQRNELLEGRTRLPLHSWNFAVLTRQGDRVRVYLNGDPQPEIDGRLIATFAPDERQWFFGARNDRFAPLVGRLDQVSVYNRALSGDEAHRLWKAANVTP
jgi:hypothetical protein